MAATRLRPLLILASVCLLVGLWSLSHLSAEYFPQVPRIHSLRKSGGKLLLVPWNSQPSSSIITNPSGTPSQSSESPAPTHNATLNGGQNPASHEAALTTSSPTSYAVQATSTSLPEGFRNPKPKYAFATFLAGTSADKDDEDGSHDNYMIAVRLLIYQILHAPETRCQDDIPFLVLVTDEVPEKKRERLRKDGAIIKVVEHIHGDGWAQPSSPHWADVLTKLRLWELTEYEKVAFIDGDVILTRPVDGVFDDPATVLVSTRSNPEFQRNDETPLPESYSFAAITQVEPEHEFPPSEENHGFPNINYLNAGFMVLQPSVEMFNYYISLTKIPDRFNQDLPEQNLLNYAHRREGNMPWKALSSVWNLQYPTVNDIQGGAFSLHDKWWRPAKTPELLELYLSWRWRMDGYYQAMDKVEELTSQADRR